MGAVNCCRQKETQDESSQKNEKTSTSSGVIATQPVEQAKEVSQSDLTFPRYPVLPSIETNKPVVMACSNGDTLAQGDSSSIMNLYNRYVDPELGCISAEGIERLCNDLEIDPEDFRILVFAYCLGAEEMCRFTEEEFVRGCTKLGITDLDSMKRTIPLLTNKVQGKEFTPFYRWTFKFALDTEAGQRTLPTQLAISLWKLVFTNNIPPLLDKWVAFLEENSSVKGISKDTWDMFLVFVEQIKGDLSSYDDTEAWPSLLDEFVEHELSVNSEN